jgi:hypothetical protein
MCAQIIDMHVYLYLKILFYLIFCRIMDFNLYCLIAFRRLRSKLSMSYFSYLGFTSYQLFYYFYTNKLIQTFNEERVILEAKLAIK